MKAFDNIFVVITVSTALIYLSVRMVLQGLNSVSHTQIGLP